MRITKYPQSNFLIENTSKKILIDPGNFTFEKYSVQEFDSPDAILVTHQHPDHLDRKAIKALSGSEVPIYGNSDVASVLNQESIKINVVESNKEFEVAGFAIKPIDLPHCKILWCESCNKKLTLKTIIKDKKCRFHPDQTPKQVDGPPNTGFLINGAFFHPGDGIELANFKVETSAIPIIGPTIDYERAWKFAGMLEANKIIPMHYSSSNPAFKADPNEFAKENPGNTKVIVLNDGEATQI
jgi:L-ascorbate metabolism protein UlaG (beta-lactamase superfamily)